MNATVVKRVYLDSAHWLPNYVGPCRNLHGHRWMVDVGLYGKVGEYSGMVLDFTELKNTLKPIVDNLDHHCLNDIVSNPTAENIAGYILNWLQKFWEMGGMVSFVRVWETPDSYAEVKRENLPEEAFVGVSGKAVELGWI